MTNKDIAGTFSRLAGLMELHNENPFKIRSYANAYISLRKTDQPLLEMDESDVAAIQGVGKSVAAKIKELAATGEIEALEKLKEKTPEGIQQMLGIKGLGPKKIKQIWKELEIESPGELLYACHENRLVELKGFGLKTQQDLKTKIEYFLDSQDKYLYASIEDEMNKLNDIISRPSADSVQAFPNVSASEWVGELARRCPIITNPEILVAGTIGKAEFDSVESIELIDGNEEEAKVKFQEKMVVTIHFTDAENFISRKFELDGSAEFIAAWKSKYSVDLKEESEASIFQKAGIPFIATEMREEKEILDDLPKLKGLTLIEDQDIKGILHNHSAYSDGLHTLVEMSDYVKDSGYEYFGICDHSQAAFYANGMKPDRVLEQMSEIDSINKKLAPFKVFKGIESDILNDGSLDYEEEILEKFDFIVASIHSNLRMDEEKATARLITAVENPHTRILGHPTSRLLLSRKGYPIDHMKVIDACAANNVVLELNANPLRLDIDYTWIPYALEKNVMIAINPDAHSKKAIHFVKYGVLAARKGWLTADMCLNAKTLEEFEKWIGEK